MHHFNWDRRTALLLIFGRLNHPETTRINPSRRRHSCFLGHRLAKIVIKYLPAVKTTNNLLFEAILLTAFTHYLSRETPETVNFYVKTPHQQQTCTSHGLTEWSSVSPIQRNLLSTAATTSGLSH